MCTPTENTFGKWQTTNINARRGVKQRNKQRVKKKRIALERTQKATMLNIAYYCQRQPKRERVDRPASHTAE